MFALLQSRSRSESVGFEYALENGEPVFLKSQDPRPCSNFYSSSLPCPSGTRMMVLPWRISINLSASASLRGMGYLYCLLSLADIFTFYLVFYLFRLLLILFYFFLASIIHHLHQRGESVLNWPRALTLDFRGFPFFFFGWPVCLRYSGTFISVYTPYFSSIPIPVYD